MATTEATTRTRRTTAPRRPTAKRAVVAKSVLSPELRVEIYGLVIVAFAVLLLLSLVSFDPTDAREAARGWGEPGNWVGPVGARLGGLVLGAVGILAFPIDLFLLVYGLTVVLGAPLRVPRRFVGGGLGAVLSGMVLLQLAYGGGRVLGHHPAGYLGAYMTEGCRALLSTAGTAVVAVTAFAIALIWLTGVSASRFVHPVVSPVLRALAALRDVVLDLWDDVRESFGRSGGAEGEDDSADAAGASRETPPVDAKDSTALPPIASPSAEHRPPLEPAWVRDRTERTPRTLVPPGRRPAAALPAGVSAPVVDGDLDEDDLDLDAVHERGVTQVDGLAGGEDEDAAAPAPRLQPPLRKAAPAGGPKIVESEAMKANPQLALTLPDPRKVPGGATRAWELPSLEFLDYEPPSREAISAELLKENAAVLEQKLLDFGVKGKVVEIHPGPVITMYEFKPAPGVKISKIANLADDLSMALAAMRVRIVAPIPGKSVVGIEVPNKARETVYLKEVMADESFLKGKSMLTLTLGKDIVGYPTVTDLAKAPHLLVAGSTGSGKSVALNSFIVSILYKATPDDVRLIMVDPKMLELSVYEGIPHLLLPVVTDPKKAAQALKWAVGEMERRYRLLAEMGVRNIAGFNARVDEIRAEAEKSFRGSQSIVLSDDDGDDDALEVEAEPLPERLPLIVVIIDELADLMMVASKDVETSIARLAQMARAAGIHLILATQRPSVDVITGLIKANFPTRVSFQVSSKIDSRTILDRQGAENLLGMGDMLFMPPGSSKLQRIHGAYIGEKEIARITASLKKQGKPQYCMEILDTSDDAAAPEEEREYDEFYDQAVGIVAETRNASISYLQRRLKIGYNRAARIVETMEEEGVIGPQHGPGPREVFVDPI